MLDARTAFTLLTVLPLRGPEHTDRRLAGRAMALAPFVGLALGLLAGSAVFATRIVTAVPGQRAQTLLPAVVGVTVLALVTRGLHLDGLADLGDGLGAWRARGRDRALEIMRESTIGAFGAIIVLFVVLLQVGALSTTISAHRGTLSILVAAMTSRLAATLACTGAVPPARPDGLGALVAGTVRTRDAALSFLAVCAVAALAGLLDFDGGGPGRALRAVLAVWVGTGVSFLLRRYLLTRFGGITGDILGGLIEITAAATLLVMAMTIPTPVLHTLGLH